LGGGEGTGVNSKRAQNSWAVRSCRLKIDTDRFWHPTWAAALKSGRGQFGIATLEVARGENPEKASKFGWPEKEKGRRRGQKWKWGGFPASSEQVCKRPNHNGGLHAIEKKLRNSGGKQKQTGEKRRFRRITFRSFSPKIRRLTHKEYSPNSARRFLTQRLQSKKKAFRSGPTRRRGRKKARPNEMTSLYKGKQRGGTIDRRGKMRSTGKSAHRPLQEGGDRRMSAPSIQRKKGKVRYGGRKKRGGDV